MHPEVHQYVAACKVRSPDHFKGGVLEIGSRDINGSIRQHFQDACIYVGIDAVAGKGVDYVCLAHEYRPVRADCQFDVVISCECFEHDPYLDQTLANIVELVRPGGLFIATMAGPDRQEHGTPRTTSKDGVPDYGPVPDFYQNGNVCDLTWALKGFFDPLEIQLVRGDCDLHIYGVRNDRLSLAKQCAGARSQDAVGHDDRADIRQGVQTTGDSQ